MNTQMNTPMRLIIEDDLRDIAIPVVDLLIAKGFVPDCTDTDDMTEFEVQDALVHALASLLPRDLLDPELQELIDEQD